MIKSQTEMTGLHQRKDPTEAEYSPTTGQRWGETTGGTYPSRRQQPEAANRDAVNAQFDALKQHFEDSMKLAKAELGAQIELLRRDIKDLQGQKEHKEGRRWDTKLVLLGTAFGLAGAGMIELLKWLVTK